MFVEGDEEVEGAFDLVEGCGWGEGEGVLGAMIEGSMGWGGWLGGELFELLLEPLEEGL